MKPAQIILIRHAESQANADKTLYARLPDWQIELTMKGWEQAREAGATIRNLIRAAGAPVLNRAGQIAYLDDEDYGVYLSPYVRTKQTLHGIHDAWSENCDGPDFVREDPRLREQERGNIRDRGVAGWDDVWRERRAQGPFFYRFPNGESGADLYDRCTTFLDTLYRDFEKPTFPRTVLIVTHSFTLRVLLMRWLHWTVDQFHQLDDPANGAMFRLMLGANGKYSLSEPFPGLA